MGVLHSIPPIQENFADHAALECAALGDSHILHSRITHAILLTNTLGLKVYQHLRTGFSKRDTYTAIATELDIPTEDATAICDDILAEWQQAGLLDASKPPFPHPASFRPALQPYESFTVNADSNSITIESEDPTLTAQLKEILKICLCEESSAPSTTISIITVEDEFGVFTNRQPVWERCDRDFARNLVLREVATHLCGRTQTAALLHAGCVADESGNSLILAGMSRQGKSTLTAGLVAAGLRYLADDLLPLHESGQSVMAFPIALGLKYGSLTLPEASSLGFTTNTTSLPREGVIYRNPPHPLPLGTQAKVSAIVFPQFDADGENNMLEIAPEIALQKLIESGTRLTMPLNSIHPLATLLNQVPAYTLSYNSSPFSQQNCLKLLSH